MLRSAGLETKRGKEEKPVPRFRAGRLEWTIAAVLLVGLVFVWFQPAYTSISLIVMAYAMGYYSGRRSIQQARPTQ